MQADPRLHTHTSYAQTPQLYKAYKGVVIWQPEIYSSFPSLANLLLLPTQGSRDHISVVPGAQRKEPGHNHLGQGHGGMHLHILCVTESGPIGGLLKASHPEMHL